MEPIPAQEIEDDWHFPKCGIDRAAAFNKQPNRPVPNTGVYARTTRAGINVRTWEQATTRERGCSRPGMVKWIATPPGLPLPSPGPDDDPQSANPLGAFVIQSLEVLVATGYTPSGSHAVQNSQSGRVVTLVAVSLGQVFWALPGDTTWSTAVNNTGESPPLNITGIVYQTSHSQKLWFVDGVNYVTYDPKANSLTTWTATAGQLPFDTGGNFARLICTWRGRIVLSGLLDDPQNWFMSAVGDPTNWDYGVGSVTSTQAEAGNNSPLGLIGDTITALIPYSDDILIFGGDHTIYMMSGDPMSGGQIDLVSDTIGMAWGMPWCKDPYGTIYFFSNRTGIYSLTPGNKPVRISQGIEQLLFGIDTGSNGIRMAWDDRTQGIHVFITPLVSPRATRHLFYEVRVGAWWVDTFANTGLDPLAVAVLDGNESDDRVILLGCWDGFVRALSPTATDDDGYPINSSVFIGPILTPALDDLTIKDLTAVMGDLAEDVTFSIYAGRTAEEAVNNPPRFVGEWKAGRNYTNGIRVSGHALYLKISSSRPWAMEQIRARLSQRGKIRRRGN